MQCNTWILLLPFHNKNLILLFRNKNHSLCVLVRFSFDQWCWLSSLMKTYLDTVWRLFLTPCSHLEYFCFNCLDCLISMTTMISNPVMTNVLNLMSVEKLVIKWWKIWPKYWYNIVSKNITSLNLFFFKSWSLETKKRITIYPEHAVLRKNVFSLYWLSLWSFIVKKSEKSTIFQIWVLWLFVLVWGFFSVNYKYSSSRN